MVIKRFLLLSGVVSLFLLNVPISVGALTADQNSLPGASNAADYQPPTGNPQNDVGGVSQGQSDQNNLQKPETIDQTALPNVTDLRVVGVTGEANSNTTKTEVTQATGKKSGWAFIFLGTAAVAAVVLVISSGKSRRSKEQSSTVEVDAKTDIRTTEDTVSTTSDSEPSGPQTPSQPTVKKSAKHKKGKNKKTKRKR